MRVLPRREELKRRGLGDRSFAVSTTFQELRQLPVAERIQLVEDLWDTIATDSAGVNLTAEHIAELDRRLDALEAGPRQGIPWAWVTLDVLPKK